MLACLLTTDVRVQRLLRDAKSATDLRQSAVLSDQIDELVCAWKGVLSHTESVSATSDGTTPQTLAVDLC